MRRELMNLMAALANTVAEVEEKEIPKFRFDGERITSAEEIAVALGISTIEAKARIRRVRTTEGAQKYGQPIGSVITEDLLPHAAMELPGKKSEWKRIYTDPDNRVSTFELQNDKRFSASIIGRDRVGNPGRSYSLEITNRKTGEKHVWSDLVSYNSAVVAFESHRDRILVAENTRRVKPKSKKRFVVQERWGTYGKDWWYGTEDEADLPEWDENSFSARSVIAMHATKELGIEVGYDPYSKDKYFNLDPKYHEVLNEYLMSLNDSYPGLTQFISKVGSGEYPNNPDVLAYNTIQFPYRNGILSVAGDRTTGVFFNPKKWGSGMSYGPFAYGQDKTKHFSVRSDSMRETYDHLDTDQQMFLFTATHEVGHTVARMVAFDEMWGTDTVSKMSEDDKNYYRSMFWWDASTIMENHGLGSSDEIYAAMVDKSSGFNGVSLTTSMVQNVLSTYGAASLHELLAEVWAEYQLDPEPRSFAAEMGAVMETVLSEWLYWNAEE